MGTAVRAAVATGASRDVGTPAGAMPGRHRARRAMPRLLLVAAVLVVLLGFAGVAAGVALVVTTVDPAEPPAATELIDDRAAAVLSWWDAERAAAYADGDVAALRALYAPGAEVGEIDVAVLEAYTARDLRVTGLGFEVVAAMVVEEDLTRLVVEVEDRLLRAEVRDAAGQSVGTLPGRDPAERALTFERAGERWVVADIRESTS